MAESGEGVATLITTAASLPAAPGGVLQVMVVEFTTLTEVAFAPPMVTFAPAGKPTPVIVIGVLPAGGPNDGETLVIAMAGEDCALTAKMPVLVPTATLPPASVLVFALNAVVGDVNVRL